MMMNGPCVHFCLVENLERTKKDGNGRRDTHSLSLSSCVLATQVEGAPAGPFQLVASAPAAEDAALPGVAPPITPSSWPTSQSHCHFLPSVSGTLMQQTWPPSTRCSASIPRLKQVPPPHRGRDHATTGTRWSTLGPTSVFPRTPLRYIASFLYQFTTLHIPASQGGLIIVPLLAGCTTGLGATSR